MRKGILSIISVLMLCSCSQKMKVSKIGDSVKCDGSTICLNEVNYGEKTNVEFLIDSTKDNFIFSINTHGNINGVDFDNIEYSNIFLDGEEYFEDEIRLKEGLNKVNILYNYDFNPERKSCISFEICDSYNFIIE